MKIEDKYKRTSFQRFIGKNGYGITRAYARTIPQAAIDQMRHRPYGGRGYGHGQDIARDIIRTRAAGC